MQRLKQSMQAMRDKILSRRAEQMQAAAARAKVKSVSDPTAAAGLVADAAPSDAPGSDATTPGGAPPAASSDAASSDASGTDARFAVDVATGVETEKAADGTTAGLEIEVHPQEAELSSAASLAGAHPAAGASRFEAPQYANPAAMRQPAPPHRFQSARAGAKAGEKAKAKGGDPWWLNPPPWWLPPPPEWGAPPPNVYSSFYNPGTGQNPARGGGFAAGPAQHWPPAQPAYNPYPAPY
jgi:hypothetical protein